MSPTRSSSSYPRKQPAQPPIGLTDLRPHDLRHTWASWQVASGVHLRVIGATLGHRSPQTVNRYAHVDVGPVRQAVQQAGDALLVAGGIKQPAKVVQLPTNKKSAVENDVCRGRCGPLPEG